MPQNSNDSLESTVRKALRDSNAMPSTASFYDPPADPELRAVYDEIYWLAIRTTLDPVGSSRRHKPAVRRTG